MAQLEAELRAIKLQQGQGNHGGFQLQQQPPYSGVPYNQRVCLKCGKTGHMAAYCDATEEEKAAFSKQQAELAKEGKALRGGKGGYVTPNGGKGNGLEWRPNTPALPAPAGPGNP